MPEPDQTPKPDTGLAEWCNLYCPTLPDKIGAVVSEFGIGVTDQQLAVRVILEHVRQSVST